MKSYLNPGYIVSRAVQYTGLPAVSVDNNLDMSLGHHMSIWLHFCERVPDLDTRSEVLHGGVFFFDSDEEALEFFDLFNHRPVYASGLYAVLYDSSGSVLTENT